ncbi:hypothetical protein ACB098_04G138300 [Castanea mollissima]|uniref:Uncharacterized protein n=1 Tax=Castanea mollissima TaxID=60419 RepID=A0A8J4QDT0_9ROSI|nr:hypothetical protein CMV_022486 [Castanea mollissima]
MKKKPEVEDKQDLEILKAVAQAWHSHSSSSRPMNEFDAHLRNIKGNPSRFKLEAMRKSSSANDSSHGATWDFGQSLCDSYEIVTLSRRLETGLLSDNPFVELDSPSRVHRRHKESRHSLRNLFNRISSRRFTEADIPRE